MSKNKQEDLPQEYWDNQKRLWNEMNERCEQLRKEGYKPPSSSWGIGYNQSNPKMLNKDETAILFVELVKIAYRRVYDVEV